MNNLDPERLYHLLPAIYRQRDLAEGEPLRAFLAVIERELQTIEADIDGLYENWFIETCEEWVVPYLADLLGIQGLSDEKSLVFSQRAYVANTIAYRRRKGTPAILENITFDVTGWSAKVVEFFDQVGISQHTHHIRPGKGSTIDIRNSTNLAQLGSPFDKIAHTVDVRRINSHHSLRGKYNIPNLGLFVWRLQTYTVTQSPAYAKNGCYTFHPFGEDTVLFNQPQPKTELSQFAETVNLPCAIEPKVLEADLKEYQAHYSTSSNPPPNSKYYGPNRSFNIIKDGTSVPPNKLVSMDLIDWQHPQSSKVAVDVKLGRLAFAVSEQPAKTLEVSYSYGFSADLGGGSYERRQTLAEISSDIWYVTVSRNDPLKTLQEALKEWNNQGKSRGIIRITDNSMYGENAITIKLPKGSQLVIEADDGVRPSLNFEGNIAVKAEEQEATLTLNGLLIKGKISVQGNLRLNIVHSTLLGGVQTGEGKNTLKLQVAISHSIIVGALYLPDEMASLIVEDSILDGGTGNAIAATDQGNQPGPPTSLERTTVQSNQPGPPTSLERTTVFGQVNISELSLASNVIFTAPVIVQRQHTGSVRFSYVPQDSQTPRRYRCQPDLALERTDIGDRIGSIPLWLIYLFRWAVESGSYSLMRYVSSKVGCSHRISTQWRLKPIFTSVKYSDPGYAQLGLTCASEISAGADDGSEMGAFHLLHQPQRAAYLRLSLDEYVPSELEAGIFYIS